MSMNEHNTVSSVCKLLVMMLSNINLEHFAKVVIMCLFT